MPVILPADRYFKEVDLTPRVSRLKDVYFRAAPEAGIKPARLVTNYSPDNVLFRKERISILDKTLSYVRPGNRDAAVRHTQAYEKEMYRIEFRDDLLFAGSTT